MVLAAVSVITPVEEAAVSNAICVVVRASLDVLNKDVDALTETVVVDCPVERATEVDCNDVDCDSVVVACPVVVAACVVDIALLVVAA